MTDHVGYLMNRIIEFIKDFEEYPTMLQLFEEFKRDASYNFLLALVLLINQGEILFDSKHNAWLYTGGKLEGEYVKLS